MICPSCGGEFRPGITVCRSCNVPLVEPDSMTTEVGDLVTILSTRDPSEAAVVRSLLEAEEIPHLVVGETPGDHLTAEGSTGIDPLSGPIEIRVYRPDWEEARALLQAMQSGEATTSLPPISAAPKRAAAVSARRADESPPSSVDRWSRPRTNPSKAFTLGLFVGAAAMFLFGAYDDGWLSPREYRVDYNDDGRADYFALVQRGHIVSEAYDRNFDGKRDDFYDHHPDGSFWRGYADDNFDGEPDSWFFFADGQLVSASADADFDGIEDTVTTYRHGLRLEQVVRPDAEGPVLVQRSFLHGGLFAEVFDVDGNGTFDRKRIYDPFGRVTREEELSR